VNSSTSMWSASRKSSCPILIEKCGYFLILLNMIFGYVLQCILYMYVCVSLRLFHCTLYKQLVFDHTLMRKGSVGRSCRAMWSKILSCGMVHKGISRRVLGDTTCDPGHWTFYFCRRGFGLVVGVVVLFVLAVLPYARGRGFDSRSWLLFIVWTNLWICVSLHLFHFMYMHT
jgi:hypothetical protein